jgi:dTDP-4-dehydrorhamnose 3,5-epimerase
LPGLTLITPRAFEDERGYFMETYKASEFAAGGVPVRFMQSNVSWSHAGVLRGFHYQIEPSAQGKLVRVLDGEVFDVVVDVQEGSPTFGRWQDVVLSAENRRMLYVPPQYGHAFCVLSDFARVSYEVTAEFDPGAERGVLWSDPDLAIPWPIESPIVSAKDQAWPRLSSLVAG